DLHRRGGVARLLDAIKQHQLALDITPINAEADKLSRTARDLVCDEMLFDLVKSQNFMAYGSLGDQRVCVSNGHFMDILSQLPPGFAKMKKAVDVRRISTATLQSLSGDPLKYREDQFRLLRIVADRRFPGAHQLVASGNKCLVQRKYS